MIFIDSLLEGKLADSNPWFAMMESGQIGDLVKMLNFIKNFFSRLGHKAD